MNNKDNIRIDFVLNSFHCLCYSILDKKKNHNEKLTDKNLTGMIWMILGMINKYNNFEKIKNIKQHEICTLVLALLNRNNISDLVKLFNGVKKVGDFNKFNELKLYIESFNIEDLYTILSLVIEFEELDCFSSRYDPICPKQLYDLKQRLFNINRRLNSFPR